MIDVKLSGTEYVIKGKTFELYTQGCSVNCPGCHNPETHDWTTGKRFPVADLTEKFNRFDRLISRFVIMGGEPLQQNLLGILDMLKFLKSFEKEVWLFTSFEMSEIYPKVLELCDYIKTGKYDTTAGDGEEMHGFKLATANQRIWKKENGGWI